MKVNYIVTGTLQNPHAMPFKFTFEDQADAMAKFAHIKEEDPAAAIRLVKQEVLAETWGL